MQGFGFANFAVFAARSLAVSTVVSLVLAEETYKFSNCLPADKEAMVINYLIIMPEPLTFPGPLTVSFDLNLKNIVGSPLEVDSFSQKIWVKVHLERKLGSRWVKLPCINFFGSCTYDDVCLLLNQIEECPASFVAAGIPCHCPFKQMRYKLPRTNFDVEASLLPVGYYHLQANITSQGAIVGCYDIMATIS